MLCFLDSLLVNLWQAIDVVVVASDSEVLCQIDDLHMAGDGMLLEELFALPMTKAEEDYVDIFEWHLVSKPQVGVADESFMHVAYKIASITLAIGEDNLCLGVVQQQANEFSARVSCRT